MFDLESGIRKWRDHLRMAGAVGAADMEELETHVRDSVEALTQGGLDTEEAFLVAIKRIGQTDALAHEFSKVNTEDLWLQLLIVDESSGTRRTQIVEIAAVFGLALLAGLFGKIPALLGMAPVDHYEWVYLRNASLFAFPSVAIYFLWKRALSWRYVLTAVIAFGAPAVLINLYPTLTPHHTLGLTALHLPIALWLLIGVLYGGAGWRRVVVRMDFVRFSGETFIYSALIVLGGAVLVLVTREMFGYINVDLAHFLNNWVMVIAGGAIPVVAAFLVERKKSVIENIAPVLARIFTPLFTVVLAGFLVAMVITGNSLRNDRNILIGFDILLAIVLGLVLYTMSARDEGAAPGGWDVLVIALLIVALIADGVALAAIVYRVSAFGASANKIAALGENILLLVNLGILAVGYLLFALGRSGYRRIVSIQMAYLPVYAIWVIVVALGFPPLFGYS